MSDANLVKEKRPASPLPASTVVLVRPTRAGGFEILMNRRPEKTEVYAGVFVFPGGRVEKSDWSPEMLDLTQGLTAYEAQQRLGCALEPEICLGHWVAAVRELYEEAGVHFFVFRDGVCANATKGMAERLALQRTLLQRGSIDLASLLAAESLYCDLARLCYFYHRVTPEHHPVRFDTHFYLAALPPRQTPLERSEEVSESLWISAADALARCQSGMFPMMPPTIAVLRTLAAHGSWNVLSEMYPLR